MQTVKIHNKLFHQYISAAEIQDRIVEISKELTKKFADKNPVFIVVLRGSFMFAADILRQFNDELSSYDGMQSTGKIKIDLAPNASKINNRDIIIIEDIVDSGLTMHFFMHYLQEFQPKSVSLVSFLYKPENMKKDVLIDHIGFTIPDLFVIGYGLDYDGNGRNLAAVYQLAL